MCLFVNLLFYKLKLMETSSLIASKGLQNVGLCSALTAYELAGIFIVPQFLDFQ